METVSKENSFDEMNLKHTSSKQTETNVKQNLTKLENDVAIGRGGTMTKGFSLSKSFSNSVQMKLLQLFIDH